MKRFLLLLCLLPAACNQPRDTARNDVAEEWQVEDIETGERVGRFRSKAEAERWMENYEKARQQRNEAAPSVKLKGGGFAKPYEFARKMKPVRKSSL